LIIRTSFGGGGFSGSLPAYRQTITRGGQ
jgi:hypothetical protein